VFDRIALPLDGSELSFRAVGTGRRLARVHGARLVLVTVATPEVGGITRAHNILAAGRRSAGVDVDTLVIDADDPANALAEFDAEHPATLMCMTTRGRGALRRRLVGGTALQVVRASPHAIVLVGPRCDPELDAPVDPIIVCLDGTPEGEAIVPWATRWGRTTGAALLLVHVVYPGAPPGARVQPSAERLEQLDYLSRLSRRIRTEHPKLRHITIAAEDPGAAIREATSGYSGAMFAVATSHPGVISDLLEGSVAGDIIRTSDVPVLIASRTGTADPPSSPAATISSTGC